MAKKSGTGISRREFARRIAIASAASVVPTSGLPASVTFSGLSPQQSPKAPVLSAESQVEADARYQAILSLYGSQFSDAQKTDLRRLCVSAQPALDRLRAYPLQNSDDPALYLKPLVERERKPNATTPAANTSPKS